MEVQDLARLKTALLDPLKMIKGAYALAIIDSKNSDTLYAVRFSSPLVIGVGKGENFLASDPSAFVGKTKNVIYLKDAEIAEITKGHINITNLEKQKTSPEIVRLEWDLEQAQKGSYPYFMLKKIFEGPETVLSALRGRLKSKESLVKLGGLEQVAGKLKEISYIHAEGYGAGEMKHGPIAMISEKFPTMAIVPQNSVSEKMFSNLEEIKARKGSIFAIATEGDKEIATLANDVFFVPKTIEPLEPFLTVVPLQLFAYYIGTQRGFDVDKPRNLAKSVTVE